MKKIGRIISVFIASLMTFSPVLALDAETLYFYAKNHIYWYDGSALLSNCIPDSTPQGSNITWIGDGEVSADEITSTFPGISLDPVTFDGVTYNYLEPGRSFSDGIGFAGKLVTEGEMKNTLIFPLGSNETVSESQIDSLMGTVGETQNVILVTGRSGNNTAILNAPNKYSNVAVSDWANTGDKVGSIYAAATTLSSASASLMAENVNYAGDQVWSDSELQMIQANRPFYEEAANKYGFPWQVLAVLHSLEHALLRDNPANGQGVYQLYTYTAGGTNENAFLPAGPISDEEFQRQTDIAASLVSSYGLNSDSDDGVKRFFFKYNGQAKPYIDKAVAMGFSQEEAMNGEGSAYVMNRFDARRDPTSSGMDPLWPGRYTRDGHYDPSSTTNNFGAYVKYIALGGTGSGFCSSTSNDIAEVALTLSWPGLRSHAKDDPKPEYITAMKDVGNYITPCNASGNCAPIGASCDIFVSTVMHYSGADMDFPQYGPSTQMAYMASNTDKYEEVNHGGDIGTLKPGDIFVTDGHIFIYVEIDGVPGQASASFNERTAEHFESIYFQDTANSRTRYYRVFRRINR